ncbi:GNAT family N-acetyltransferase [Pelobium sp.]|nr:GNAT family N-acetyltransferase [Pelobium sp.]MDA9555072.1 GNAT family N-acetyltransferase [Pelobium sp.]
MNHILDNPIYNALKTRHVTLAEGESNTKYYQRDMASFAGMENYSSSDLLKLYELLPDNGVFIVFYPEQLAIPSPWKIVREIDMFQFVYEQEDVPPSQMDVVLTDLNHNHVEEMTALVELTKPGPFISKTIDFGNYTGVFNNERLAAMAGHRFHPEGYIEVSAVCTHPDFLGKGYAYAIIREQIKRIKEKSQIPFLHVRQDNEGAIKLYQKIGFNIRTKMQAYVLAK